MHPKLKYNNVNWEDGMKISKDHFIHQENVLMEQIGDARAASLKTFRYGLLATDSHAGESLKTSVNIDNQEFLKVKVFACRAVTQGGTRIEILEEHQLSELSVNISDAIKNSSSDGEDYYILLTTDVFNRQSFGKLDASEEPPRYPYVIPNFQLSIMAESRVSNEELHPGSLFIGKMNISNHKPEVYEDYLPPCLMIKSHQQLITFYNEVIRLSGKLEIDLISIIRKIREKDQDSNLAKSVFYLTEKLLNFLTENLLSLKWEYAEKPPLALLEFLATVARVIRNSIDTLSSSAKEELLNYFTNWSELKQGDFEKLLVYCINFEYRHSDILISLEQFSEFMQILEQLFEKLESLAYIGKKKETNIFVKEHKTKKRSFLAD